MIQNLPDENLIKSYLLGDLSENDQDQIQARLFTDPEFFEGLLIIEDELTDDYAFGLLSDPERRKVERRFLVTPQQRQKLSLATALRKYSSESVLKNTSQAFIDYEARLKPFETRRSIFPRFLSRLFPHNRFRKRLSNTDVSIQKKPGSLWESRAAEAQANRNLLASLINKDWLGLHLLAQLRSSSPSTIMELASNIEVSNVDIALILNKLVQCHLVDKQQRVFSCTQLGAEILEKIEKATGVSLNP